MIGWQEYAEWPFKNKFRLFDEAWSRHRLMNSVAKILLLTLIHTVEEREAWWGRKLEEQNSRFQRIVCLRDDHSILFPWASGVIMVKIKGGRKMRVCWFLLKYKRANFKKGVPSSRIHESSPRIGRVSESKSYFCFVTDTPQEEGWAKATKGELEVLRRNACSSICANPLLLFMEPWTTLWPPWDKKNKKHGHVLCFWITYSMPLKKLKIN